MLNAGRYSYSLHKIESTFSFPYFSDFFLCTLMLFPPIHCLHDCSSQACQSLILLYSQSWIKPQGTSTPALSYLCSTSTNISHQMCNWPLEPFSHLALNLDVRLSPHTHTPVHVVDKPWSSSNTPTGIFTLQQCLTDLLLTRPTSLLLTYPKTWVPHSKLWNVDVFCYRPPTLPPHLHTDVCSCVCSAVICRVMWWRTQ